MLFKCAYLTKKCSGFEWHAPIYYARNVIDPTGSGDVFLGAFVYAILSHMSPAESLSFTTAAVSLLIEGEDLSENNIIHRMKFLMNNLTHIPDKTYEEILFY